jgi:hypothetical protein
MTDHLRHPQIRPPSTLISYDELRAFLNASQECQVIKWLNDRRIRWDRDAKKRPITTLSAIEKYLFKENAEDVDFS